MFKIVPRDEKFFDQIEELSSLVKTAAERMADLVGRFPSTDGISDQIGQLRDEAAGVMQSTLQCLDQAFITPLDREDIMELLSDLYDVVDTISQVARRFKLYGLQELYPNLRTQAETLRKVATALDRVLNELRRDKKLKDLSGQFDEIFAFEKEAATNREAFLSNLFSGTPDPIDLIKKKELHDMLESAIADCENVTRTLSRVLLKNG